jgi:hypothetical protein
VKIITSILLGLTSAVCLLCAMCAPDIGMGLLCVGLTIITAASSVMTAVDAAEGV